VLGKLTEPLIDSFGAARSGGGYHQHRGQDLMARKMTPLVAVFSGVVRFARTDSYNAHNILYLDGDNGYTAAYMHINNDTPGSNSDGLGSREYAFAPNLRPNRHVIAGQFLGWVGNSGDARGGDPHLHFELEHGAVLINAFRSLKQAQHINAPRYILPAPTELPTKGEVRMDAVVRTVDIGRQVMAVWAVAYRNADGKETVVTKPLQKWLRIAPGTVIVHREDATGPVALTDLQSGDEVTLFCPAKTEAATLAPKRLLAELMPRPAPMVASARRNFPVQTGSAEQPDNNPASDALPTGTPARPARQEPTVLLAPPADLADRLKDHLNYYRSNRGLGAVARDKRLDHVAQSAVENMVQGGFDGRVNILTDDCARRVGDTSYKAGELYVSVAVQQSTPEKAIEFWKQQRSDQVGLFRPDVTDIGVGYAEGNVPGFGFQRYWVLLLAAPAENNPMASP
jgi:uncharacterized protein YkwD